MNIIIPIGGIGQRFKDEGYLMPKPLINVLGKPMISRVIDSLNITDDDCIYIVYNNQLREFNFESLIKFYFPKKSIKFISLNHLTKGAAETVLCCLNTLSNVELNKNFLLVDCDTFYTDDIITSYKESEHKNLVYYFEDMTIDPIFSYIKIDSDNKILDIKEKEKISDNANTGAYGFAHGHLLKTYCEQILNVKNSELYISHIYNNLLKDNIEVYGKKINNFHCVGTPLQLKIYCNKYKNKSEQLRICFDLDNTLVSYPKIHGDYTSVDPIIKNINFAKFLKSLGHTIIIHTARRMKTHNGSVGGVIADIGKVTIDTLDKFKIPYDELYFGKPYANFYIDDLGINPMLSMDKGLGIFNTTTSPREFNKVEFHGSTMTKYTANEGEVFWYKNIPDSIKSYFPEVHIAEDNKLILENIDGVTYSYLYTHKELTVSDLYILLRSLTSVYELKSNDDINIYSNYFYKLSNRYYANKRIYKDIPNSKELFTTISQRLKDYEDNNLGKQCIIHGDLVFTNIIKTKNSLKFIDMRGKIGDVLSIEGDIYYDYAKIYQSIIGYDYILNDIEMDNVYMNQFLTEFESHFTVSELNYIKLITASLLFSLIPLHSDTPEKFNTYFTLIKTLL